MNLFDSQLAEKLNTNSANYVQYDLNGPISQTSKMKVKKTTNCFDVSFGNQRNVNTNI